MVCSLLSNTLFIRKENGSKFQIFYEYIFFPKKVFWKETIYGQHCLHKLKSCKSWNKENCYRNFCPGPSNRSEHQIESQLTSWQYPLINYHAHVPAHIYPTYNLTSNSNFYWRFWTKSVSVNAWYLAIILSEPSLFVKN